MERPVAIVKFQIWCDCKFFSFIGETASNNCNMHNSMAVDN